MKRKDVLTDNVRTSLNKRFKYKVIYTFYLIALSIGAFVMVGLVVALLFGSSQWKGSNSVLGSTHEALRLL